MQFIESVARLGAGIGIPHTAQHSEPVLPNSVRIDRQQRTPAASESERSRTRKQTEVLSQAAVTAVYKLSHEAAGTTSQHQPANTASSLLIQRWKYLKMWS